MFDDLQVAMTLVDDFMGNTATSGTIGQLGWALPAGGTGTAAAAAGASEPGIFVVGTGTTASGWHGINLGSNNLIGSPVLMCDWRVKLTNVNNASDKFSCWFGLHNARHRVEPTSGFYFRYTPDDTHWFAACADGGTPNAVTTNVVADTNFHRFRITSDGVGVARFYIDDAQVAMLSSSLPSTNRYTPNVMIRKTAGTAARNVACRLLRVAIRAGPMTPPNVLLILSDDQRFDFLEYMPNTRNLIAFQGRDFKHTRCNVAVCEPTRVEPA